MSGTPRLPPIAVLDAPTNLGLKPPAPGREPGVLREILKAAFSSGMAAGLEVTIFDPDLDPDGRIAAGFVEELARAFRNG